MRILAIDPGSRCGWACLKDIWTESGVQDFSLKRGESAGMRFIRFTAWLDEITDLMKPNLIGFEQSHHRGGYATEVLIGMVTRIEEICARKGIEYMSIHSASLKKFATGNGRANKNDMIEAAKKQFNKIVIDDNEADALFLLDYIKREIYERR